VSATAHIPPADPLEAVASIEERRALIERIAASALFSRSARLRDFLLYVGGQSLKEGCPEIHEQEIGIRVFDRPASYDRSQDNIVRVNATELRKRIDLYFATEGAHESLTLEIPRGGYKPVFHWRLPAVEVVPAETASIPVAPIAPLETQTPTPAPHKEVRAHFVWGGISFVLAAVCVLVLLQNRTLRAAASPWDGKPAVAAFWSGFLKFPQQTDIVLPDDSVSIVQDLVHHPISLDDYLSRDYMRQIQSSKLSPDQKSDINQVDSHNLITYGGVSAARQMTAMLPSSSPSHLTLSRYYTADALKRNNVILIGGKKANPWVHLFDDQLNFITDYDHANSHAFIGNMHPKPGEQASYVPPNYPSAFIGYAVVAYLPNPSKTGNAIILAGTDSDATSAAAEFLASESQLESLRRELHVDQLPYFEVLLKTSRVSGTSLNAERIAYRGYPGIR
jgi:hypothetical protein